MGIANNLEGILDTVHGTISTFLGTGAPAPPPVGTPPALVMQKITLDQAGAIVKATGLSVSQLQALGYVILG